MISMGLPPTSSLCAGPWNGRIRLCSLATCLNHVAPPLASWADGWTKWVVSKCISGGCRLWMCFGNARADNVMEGLALLQFGVYERATIPPPLCPKPLPFLKHPSCCFRLYKSSWAALTPEFDSQSFLGTCIKGCGIIALPYAIDFIGLC